MWVPCFSSAEYFRARFTAAAIVCSGKKTLDPLWIDFAIWSTSPSRMLTLGTSKRSTWFKRISSA